MEMRSQRAMAREQETQSRYGNPNKGESHPSSKDKLSEQKKPESKKKGDFLSDFDLATTYAVATYAYAAAAFARGNKEGFKRFLTTARMSPIPEVEESSTRNLSLKVMINKQNSKVIFAEANNDVVDVLLSFLTLPLGELVKVLEKHYGNEAAAVGSLTTLYRGLSNLDSSHLCASFAKQILRNNGRSFRAGRRGLKIYRSFMIRAASFAISDDLQISPILPAFLQTLSNLGITDTSGAEMNILSLDGDDIMDLLKFSLFSRTPLTDLVVKKTKKRFISRSRPEAGLWLHHHIQNGEANPRARKMTLKIFLQKSSNKFLLSVASDEFVKFLFSFLTVPLGGVQYFLRGNTCLKNMDNLYRSVRDVIDDKYFISPFAKTGLMNPKLAQGYASKNQFLPLAEDIPYQGSFHVKKQYIVRDDLTVTPFSITSSISIPNGLGIALSDVTEKDFQIGEEEALSILKASLSSTSPLTDVLLNKPTLNKLPKRPKREYN